MPAAVVAELERLVARRTPHAAAAAAFARSLRPVGSDGRGDAAVVAAARRLRASVVTADRELAERLRRVGIAVLAPRDRVRLELKLPRPPSVRGQR